MQTNRLRSLSLRSKQTTVNHHFPDLSWIASWWELLHFVVSSDTLPRASLFTFCTLLDENSDEQLEASDYLVTLLRDPTASHLLETMVSRCPDPAFNILWMTYFRGKLARLATHPVANFVVAKAAERLNPAQLKAALEELESSWNKIIGM